MESVNLKFMDYEHMIPQNEVTYNQYYTLYNNLLPRNNFQRALLYYEQNFEGTRMNPVFEKITGEYEPQDISIFTTQVEEQYFLESQHN